MTRIHWVARGTGTPKDRDEVKANPAFELLSESRTAEVELVTIMLRKLNS